MRDPSREPNQSVCSTTGYSVHGTCIYGLTCTKALVLEDSVEVVEDGNGQLITATCPSTPILRISRGLV